MGMTTSQRDVLLAAAESVQQRGLCKDGNYFADDGSACAIGHLALVTDAFRVGKNFVDIGDLPFESLTRYVQRELDDPLAGITEWNDHHASVEDVILMFKTLAEEAE
jgi:hypothetical protein